MLEEILFSILFIYVCYIIYYNKSQVTSSVDKVRSGKASISSEILFLVCDRGRMFLSVKSKMVKKNIRTFSIEQN